MNAGGTLCTTHHHMVMQKDVLHALVKHVLQQTNSTLLDKILEAQAQPWPTRFMSEFDLYFAFVVHRFPERVALGTRLICTVAIILDAPGTMLMLSEERRMLYLWHVMTTGTGTTFVRGPL